jgi:hypothetical protein
VKIVLEDESERKVVEQLRLDWLLYGQIHLTNAPRGLGLTRLDPARITYYTGNLPQPMKSRGSTNK